MSPHKVETFTTNENNKIFFTDILELFNWTKEMFINLLAPELIFFILAHPVCKMWIIQEPNTLELWNKLHFEGGKTESIYRV